MPKKSHPFQRELQERLNDKACIERELKLRQRIHSFAELSEKERRQRFAILIAEKQRQYIYRQIQVLNRYFVYWLPWPGTVYAVPQYPAVPVFFFLRQVNG